DRGRQGYAALLKLARSWQRECRNAVALGQRNHASVQRYPREALHQAKGIDAREVHARELEPAAPPRQEAEAQRVRLPGSERRQRDLGRTLGDAPLDQPAPAKIADLAV